MGDILDKAKAQRNKWERLVSKLPLYKGYKEKELRRETDKLLRDKVAAECKTQWERIADLQRQMITSGMLAYVDDLQVAETRLRRFMDRVRNAAYGYGGLFDATKVDEETLDAVYDFDLALMDQVALIAESLDGVEQAIAAGEDVPKAIRKATSAMSAANKVFDRREAILRGTG